jgi:hypothetical protein
LWLAGNITDLPDSAGTSLPDGDFRALIEQCLVDDPTLRPTMAAILAECGRPAGEQKAPGDHKS